MIIDSHIHYTPEELIVDKAVIGNKPHTLFINGAPAYTFHDKLFRLENHIACMDMAGVDKAVISSGAGLVTDLDRCKLLNDKLKEAEDCYPGRIPGLAHVPLGKGGYATSLQRCCDPLDYRRNGTRFAPIMGLGRLSKNRKREKIAWDRCYPPRCQEQSVNLLEGS